MYITSITFDSMNMLVSSWNVVLTKAIVNGFRKTGIYSSSQKLGQTDGDNPFKELCE